MRIGGFVVAVVLSLSAAGCGQDVDEDAWRADVEEEQGQAVGDWPTYRDVWVRTCEGSETGFGLFIATALDGGYTLDSLRLNVRHACPDRLDELEETQAGIDDTRQACDVTPADRTDEQARLAEALGC